MLSEGSRSSYDEQAPYTSDAAALRLLRSPGCSPVGLLVKQSTKLRGCCVLAASTTQLEGQVTHKLVGWGVD